MYRMATQKVILMISLKPSGNKHSWLWEKWSKFVNKGLNKVRRKLKDVTKSDIIKNDIEFKTQNKKIKAKNQRYRNMKNQKTERQKP